MNIMVSFLKWDAKYNESKIEDSLTSLIGME